MEKLTDMKSLFIMQLERLLDAESLQFAEFQGIVLKISNKELRGVIENHTKNMEERIDRLEQVFYLMHQPIHRKPCEAMDALLDEALELMDTSFTHEVMDAGLLACFQKMKLYEIAAYGSACSYAETLNEQRAANLLHDNLVEEKSVDQALTRLAIESINIKALTPDEEILVE